MTAKSMVFLLRIIEGTNMFQAKGWFRGVFLTEKNCCGTISNWTEHVQLQWEATANQIWELWLKPLHLPLSIQPSISREKVPLQWCLRLRLCPRTRACRRRAGEQGREWWPPPDRKKGNNPTMTELQSFLQIVNIWFSLFSDIYYCREVRGHADSLFYAISLFAFQSYVSFIPVSFQFKIWLRVRVTSDDL